MLGMKDKDKTFDWIQRELQVANDLYVKIQDEFEDEDQDLKEFIPDPLTYFTDHAFYQKWWDNFKINKQTEFKKKHKESIDHLEAEKDKNWKKLAMTEEEKILFFLKQDDDFKKLREKGLTPFTPPAEYYDDLKAIRGFFNSTFPVYMSLVSKIIDLLEYEFDYFWMKLDGDLDLKDRLQNKLHPFGNKFLYEKHAKECDGCKDCEKLTLDEHMKSCFGCRVCE